MKNKHIIIVGITCLLFLYLTSAFVVWEINAAYWNDAWRDIFLFLSFVVVMLGIVAIICNNNINKKK